MARTITVFCDDSEAMYPALVDLLARYVSNKLRQPIAPAPAANSQPMESTEETEVRLLYAPLGQGSQEFVSDVAEWCSKKNTVSFTLDDIADATGKNKSDLKAHNRNVNRAMKEKGVRLWNTTWDSRKRRMNFTIVSQAYLDAMSKMV